MVLAQAQLSSDHIFISTPASSLIKPYNEVDKVKLLPMVSKPDMPRYADITPVFVGIAG